MGLPLWFTTSLLSSLCWGLNFCVTEESLKTVRPTTMLFWWSVASAVLTGLLGGMVVVDDLKTVHATQQGVYLFYLAIVLAVAANGFNMYALTLGNASYVSLVESMYPLFVLFFSWLFFHVNVFTPVNLVGTVLVLSGVALICTQSTSSAPRLVDIDLQKRELFYP
mmetsp:Transcript_46402/g.116853  ORF Transcript_46402/g.116853 Transcript_46402/m.116853 type:complete len:166 (-) Transcript_46402:77-574(-)|eukprot:CAMPEP_0177669264 /NCGR_PEP_ID=MMETSP0447-20121125/23328_1 /TAXON_ID=0 /ORGANISM="Stygamoeba regulata, Strain BSH-02190019" /LENGTH=165 /DNA_ID=CAMNT_0019176079 /DNA_START=98 /DNA_END=595 /DNA_ORIENTATION=+